MKTIALALLGMFCLVIIYILLVMFDIILEEREKGICYVCKRKFEHKQLIDLYGHKICHYCYVTKRREHNKSLTKK